MAYDFDYVACDTTLFTEAEQARLKKFGKFTLRDIVDFGKEPFDKNDAYMFGLPVIDPLYKNLYDTFLNANYSSFVDIPNRKVFFDDGEFAAFLTLLADCAKSGYIKPDIPPAELFITSARRSHPDLPHFEERFFYKLRNTSLSGLLQLYFDEEAFLTRTYFPGNGKDDADLAIGLIAGNNGDVTASMWHSFAINALSANRRTAWEFVKFLASDEMQYSRLLGAYPINNKAFEGVTKLEMMDRRGVVGSRSEYPDDFPETLHDEYDAYTSKVKEFTDMINIYTVRDPIIDDMIRAEALAYLNGEKSADEAARVLQRKVTLYFDEFGG
jgi:ABC-type glycerol-3-phosphate transport system substrate-binding protein